MHRIEHLEIQEISEEIDLGRVAAVARQKELQVEEERKLGEALLENAGEAAKQRMTRDKMAKYLTESNPVEIVAFTKNLTSMAQQVGPQITVSSILPSLDHIVNCGMESQLALMM